MSDDYGGARSKQAARFSTSKARPRKMPSHPVEATMEKGCVRVNSEVFLFGHREREAGVPRIIERGFARWPTHTILRLQRPNRVVGFGDFPEIGRSFEQHAHIEELFRHLLHVAVGVVGFTITPMKLQSRHARFGSIVALLLAAGCQSASLEQASPAVFSNSSNASAVPGNIPAPYTAEGLTRAFADLCQMLGYRALRVRVDQSEFPFVVYGVLEGNCDYNDMRDALNTMAGYAYAGCGTSIYRGGSRTILRST